MPAVATFDFDPTVTPFGLTIRLDTLALAAIVVLVLILVAVRAGRATVPVDASPAPRRGARRLRRDDLILFAFGAIPGALVGGRIGYGLIHWDYYAANQDALYDPAGGGLTLTLAVALGTLCAVAVARLLSAPVGRWLGVARGPVLLGLGLGKFAMALGGAGQGAFSDQPWATAYPGPGPWGSPDAGYPALPSQVLEGVLVLLALALLVIVLPLLARVRVHADREAVEIGLYPPGHRVLPSNGRGFALGLVFWAVARFVAAFTWRDARVLGPLNAEQLVVLGLVAVLVAFLVAPYLVRELRAALAGEARAAGETEAWTEDEWLPGTWPDRGAAPEVGVAVPSATTGNAKPRLGAKPRSGSKPRPSVEPAPPTRRSSRSKVEAKPGTEPKPAPEPKVETAKPSQSKASSDKPA